MQIRCDYPEHKTARQWAKHGFLPKEGAEGIELWANQYRQDSYIYYGVEEVERHLTSSCQTSLNLSVNVATPLRRSGGSRRKLKSRLNLSVNASGNSSR